MANLERALLGHIGEAYANGVRIRTSDDLQLWVASNYKGWPELAHLRFTMDGKAPFCQELFNMATILRESNLITADEDGALRPKIV